MTSPALASRTPTVRSTAGVMPESPRSVGRSKHGPGPVHAEAGRDDVPVRQRLPMFRGDEHSTQYRYLLLGEVLHATACDERGRWQRGTPTMAAGFVDHVSSWDDGEISRPTSA